jgi:hypothetical protein
MILNVTVYWVILLLCTWEILGLILGAEAGYPEVFVVFLRSPGIC